MERDPRGSERRDTRRGRRAAGRPHASGRRYPVLLLVAIGLLTALAVAAPSGQASGGAEAEARRQARASEDASRAAARDAERVERRTQRESERDTRRKSRREAKRREREPWKSKEKTYEDGAHAVVGMDCTGVKVEYSGFKAIEGSPNQVMEWVVLRGLPESISETGTVDLPPVLFEFEGSSGTSILRIALPAGRYTLDIHGRWDTNGNKGAYDIHGVEECGYNPAFTIEKEQTIAGSGKPFTTAKLAADVGQTVDYRLLVTNTGNTPLNFGPLIDPRCSSISGGSENPIEPFATIEFTCSHTLTTADEGSEYTNVGEITGTPEPGEGEPIRERSNLVAVGPVGPEPKEEEGGGGKKEGGGTEPTPPPPNPGGNPPSKQEILNTTNSGAGGTGAASKSGVLGFSSATVPALHGPQGCVRGRFTASVRSAGVASVTFYLDGRKIKHLTAANAHKGLLSVTIEAARLKVGAHHVTAKITMKKTTATAKAATATRRLTVVRCHSAVITPRFTG